MEIKFELKHIVGILVGLILIVLAVVLFLGTRWFKPLIAVGVFIGVIQFFLDFFKENKRQKEIEVKFLEFVRNLVESVRSGIPVTQAVIQIKDVDYGALSPYVKKLGNQIEWGIPISEALSIFSNDTGNTVIKKSIAIVREAELSGGNIGDVLDSVSKSVVQIKNLKEERKASAYSQMIQGYIVFFVFIGIMLVLQIKLIPKLSEMGGFVMQGFTGEITMGESIQITNLNNIFLWLIVIQGFFAGLMIGKFAEGDLKTGVKHSLILMTAAYLIITTVRGF